MADTTTDELFQKALTSYGQDYLIAEKALRAGGETTATALKLIAADTKKTPLTRFIAATIAAAISGQADEFDAAMDGLDNLATYTAKTPLGVPSPDTAASELTLYSDFSDFAALRLLKEIDWPEWKVMTVIVYLGYYATSSVSPALDQFRADLKDGKRPALCAESDEQTNAVIAKLDEAAQLVAIVIKDDQFQTDLTKAKDATGKDKLAAAEEAVARALSVITADPDRARRISSATDTLKTLLVEPVLQATSGVVDDATVRQILAGYLLSGDSPTTDQSTDTTTTDTDTSSETQ